MAPKSKKGPKNGYYYFMQVVRDREEAKGRKFSSMTEVADFASSLWSKMDSKDREVYTKMSKNAKGESDSDHLKFTSLGVSYATVDAEIREAQESHDIMVQTINSTVRRLTREELLTHKFYLCHANYFYKTDSDFYSIAEIALSKFNLVDGLIDRMHYFVDPGKMPTGYRYEAKDWAEKTHGIPLNWSEGVKDYHEIYTTIKNFLTKDNPAVIPPIYSMPNSLNSNMCISAVRSAFATLCDINDECPSQFRIYSFPQLFFEIRNKCVENRAGVSLIPSVAMAQNEIEKDVFSYAQNIGCQFHERMDRPIHCSLSVVTRWVYSVCDHCCKHVGISLELGRHCPTDADVNWDFKQYKNHRKQPEDPPPEKNKNCFMPTIIDHGILKEQREEQFREEQERLKNAAQMRLPKSSIPACFLTQNGNRRHETDPLSQNFNRLHLDNSARDEPSGPVPLMDLRLRHDDIIGVRTGNRATAAASGGRGLRTEVRNRDAAAAAWPISGRGRFLSQ